MHFPCVGKLEVHGFGKYVPKMHGDLGKTNLQFFCFLVFFFFFLNDGYLFKNVDLFSEAENSTFLVLGFYIN